VKAKLYFLKALGALYFFGFILHLLDVLNLRLNFSELPLIWKAWIIYLLIFDLVTAILLWKELRLGEILFLTVATSQLVAYIGFTGYFGNQIFLIIFHVACIAMYILLSLRQRNLNRP